MRLPGNDSCAFEYDPVDRSLTVHWEYMHDSQQMREALDIGFAYCAQYEVEHWIADSSRVRGAMHLADQQWAARTAGRFAEAGLKSIINVLPTSALGRLSAQGWQSRLAERHGFVMLQVSTLAEAREAVTRLRGGQAA